MARKTALKINPNKLKTRDPLMLRLINGATKSGFHRERREAPKEYTCRRCFGEYMGSGTEDGFCSEYCAQEYDRQISGSEVDQP